MRALLLAPLLAWACSASTPGEPREPSVELSWARGGGEIRLEGRALGELRADGADWYLRGPGLLSRLTVTEQPLGPEHPYPRRVRSEGRMDGSASGIVHEYTLLAPAAPLPVEGFGLVASDDPPGTNDAEHEALRAWLGRAGAPRGHASLRGPAPAGDRARAARLVRDLRPARGR